MKRMDERINDNSEKMDEIMLPGFRFHPTDEELVGFYLRRKVQQRPLSIELIKQLDIYKYDPWDLPKLATTGEKEWYFYCPRDRKYRNSARPNRVTGAGFWKATGTDRPIYSSEGSKCIGLKKSLVFYKGRAAKGLKTDWMMHEFRLPSISDTGPSKRCIDKDNIPANDAWAICRIFKKANSSSQRALSHSWVIQCPLPETSTTNITTTTSSDLVTQNVYGSTIFSSNHDMYLTAKNSIGSLIQFGDNTTTFSHLDHNPPIYKSIINTTEPPQSHELPTSSTVDASSLLLNMSSSVTFGDFGDKLLQDQQFFHSFHDHHHHEEEGAGRALVNDLQPWETMQSAGYPFNLPLNNMGMGDAWKCNLFWDSSPCPSSDLSTSFSTNKCYT